MFPRSQRVGNSGCRLPIVELISFFRSRDYRKLQDHYSYIFFTLRLLSGSTLIRSRFPLRFFSFVSLSFFFLILPFLHRSFSLCFYEDGPF